MVGVRVWLGAALVVMCLCSANVQAGMYDFTNAGSHAVINGATFMTVDIAPTGTGAIEPFVRIQKNGTEQGYNTGTTDFAYNEKAGIWTHPLLLSVVRTVYLSGEPFYEFGLDINQAGNPGSLHSLLSLDRLLIFRGDSPSPVHATGADQGKALHVEDLGTPLYNMDGPGSTDNWVTMNFHLGAGSGKGDVYVYVPHWMLAAGTGNYVYLYSRFGDHNASNDGFEEWFEDPQPSQVPVPGAVFLGMLGMSAAGWRLRKFA